MNSKPLMPPVVLSATYQFETTADLMDVVQHRSGFIYSRWDNPTVRETEKALAVIEGYSECIGFGSGMAAITTAVLAVIEKGQRIVTIRETYGGTFAFFNTVLPKLGVDVCFVECDDVDRIYSEIDKGAAIVYLETPTNPLLKIVDIKPITDAAHKNGALVFLDSTFASPVNQRPVDFGVDVTIHSATKYLGGHHDATAGFVCCENAISEKIWNYRRIMGGVLDPMTAFLVYRGMKTLELRVNRQNETAMQIAGFLEKQAKIKAVYYPGLVSHPHHEIAKRQMKGYGGMISFEVDSDYDGTLLFMDCLKMVNLATSLGGASSLATQPITNTHAGLSAAERAKAGISESLVRISVGLEDAAAIETDIKQALEKI